MKHSVKFTRTFSLFAHLSPHLGGANDSVKCLKIHFWRRFPNRKRGPYQQWGNEKFFKNDPKWAKSHHFSYIFFFFSETESIESYVFPTLWPHLGAEKWQISYSLYLEISAFGAIPNTLLLTILRIHIQLSISEGQSKDSIKLTRILPCNGYHWQHLYLFGLHTYPYNHSWGRHLRSVNLGAFRVTPSESFPSACCETRQQHDRVSY